MIRTQIQIPDWLYGELKRVARERELSLADVLRRGAEYITRVYKPLDKTRKDWELPRPFDLGVKGDPFADEDWRYNLHVGNGAAAMVREKAEPPSKRKEEKV